MIRVPCVTACMLWVWTLHGACGETMSASVYEGARADIEAAFETDRRSCESLEGNSRRVCLKESTGREQIALARLEFLQRGDPDSEQKLKRLQYEVRYEVARQRCEALAGAPRQHCLERAQTERKLARESLTATGQLPEVVDEQVAIKRRADQALAMSRCEALGGEARAVCAASVAARYGD